MEDQGKLRPRVYHIQHNYLENSEGRNRTELRQKNCRRLACETVISFTCCGKLNLLREEYLVHWNYGNPLWVGSSKDKFEMIMQGPAILSGLL